MKIPDAGTGSLTHLIAFGDATTVRSGNLTKSLFKNCYHYYFAHTANIHAFFTLNSFFNIIRFLQLNFRFWKYLKFSLNIWYLKKLSIFSIFLGTSVLFEFKLLILPGQRNYQHSLVRAQWLVWPYFENNVHYSENWKKIWIFYLQPAFYRDWEIGVLQ